MEEIKEVSASSLTSRSRPFCPSCSMDKEAGEAAANNTTLVSVAREKTTGKTREENPGTARERFNDQEATHQGTATPQKPALAPAIKWHHQRENPK